MYSRIPSGWMPAHVVIMIYLSLTITPYTLSIAFAIMSLPDPTPCYRIQRSRPVAVPLSLLLQTVQGVSYQEHVFLAPPVAAHKYLLCPVSPPSDRHLLFLYKFPAIGIEQVAKTSS